MAVKKSASKPPVRKPTPKAKATSKPRAKPKARVTGSKTSVSAKQASGGGGNTSNQATPASTQPRDVLESPTQEQPPREDFVNPLDRMSESSGETSQTAESQQAGQANLPEGVSSEQAGQTVQQIQNFANLATHLPTILGMGDEIREGGIQEKHVEALKAAYEPLKGLLTPENIQAFRDMDLNQVDQLLSPQNLDILRSVAPELANQLDPERIKKLKEGMQKAQGMLDKDKLARGMNMMAPFVETRRGQGALNLVAGMVDDPNQLGGADQQLSMTDIRAVTQGLLNTGPVQGFVNGEIANGINQFVNYRQNGRPRWRVGRNALARFTSRPKVQNKIYSKAWQQVRAQAPGQVSSGVAPYLGSGGDPRDGSIRRRFNDGDIQQLMDAGQQVQSMRGQNGSSGFQEIDNANQAMAGATGILHQSLVGDDGRISGDELRTVADFGTQLYRYMGLLYEGTGGSYR